MRSGSRSCVRSWIVYVVVALVFAGPALAQTEFARAMLVDAQMRVLVQYAIYLRRAHQRPKARQIEGEVLRLKDEKRPECRGCTIHVMTLPVCSTE
jgi:hypothetical protein